MKVLYLTKYTRIGASSRMRSFQYFPYLERTGTKVIVRPLFNDQYLQSLYSGKSSPLSVISSYINRFFVLFTLYKYDKVVIEKELFPYLPAWPEWLMNKMGIKYIVDYDDAIFHNYDLHPNPIIRKLLGKKIDQVMKNSNTVIAGNSYLAKRAENAGSESIFILPTVIDLDRYVVKKAINRSSLVIGWIGTKSTFEKHLLPCKDWIQKAIDKYNVEFHIVGITQDMGLGNGVSYIPWSEETEVSSILNFDIGIMPLQDSVWEKGKCAYKLIQYMACGLPVIASPIGMNKEVVKNDINGFLAECEEEWLDSIGKLVRDAQLRINYGLNGRELVEKEYCLRVTSTKLENIISL